MVTIAIAIITMVTERDVGFAATQLWWAWAYWDL